MLVPRPEEASWGHRVVVTVAVLTLCLLLVAAFVWLSGGWHEAEGAPFEKKRITYIYEGVALDAALLELDKRALEEAYHESVKKLWTVWLSTGEPRYFMTGIRRAREAYHQAAEQIARREDELRRGHQSPQ